MGFFKTISTVVVVSASLLYEATDAGVQVLDDTGASIPVDAWSCTPGESPDSWIIELNELWNPWGNTWFRIMVDPGEDIEQLLIAVDGPPAGSPVTVTVGEAGSPVRCVHRIRQTGTAEVILHQLNVVESLGSIEVQSINFIDVGGHVNGPIIVTNSTSDLRGIRRMDVAGDILGDIIVADGTIRELVVLGDIGSPQEIVRIEVGIGLWNIDVRGDINATVDLCATGSAGFLHRLRANDFNGTLSVDRLDRPAGEDEPPVLSLTGWLSGMWSIAGSLQDQEAVVELPPGGLRGQVIVNANGDAQGTWETPLPWLVAMACRRSHCRGQHTISRHRRSVAGPLDLFRIEFMGTPVFHHQEAPSHWRPSMVVRRFGSTGPCRWVGARPCRLNARSLVLMTNTTALMPPNSMSRSIRMIYASSRSPHRVAGVGSRPAGPIEFVRPARCDAPFRSTSLSPRRSCTSWISRRSPV